MRSTPQRGRAAHAAIELLPAYRGTVVHDGSQAYCTADAPQYLCRHALCGVHLLRELTYLAEEYRLRWDLFAAHPLIARRA